MADSRSGLGWLAFVHSIRQSAPARAIYRILPLQLRAWVARNIAARAARAASFPALPAVQANKRPRPEFSAATTSASAFAGGANLFAYYRGQFGLAEAARLYTSALMHVGYPVAINDVQIDLPHGFDDSSFADKLQTDAPHQINLVFVNPDYFKVAIESIGPERMLGRYIIACWFWELEYVPTEWLPALDNVDEILVASEFIEQAFRRATDKPVTKVPLPLFDEQDSGLQRKDFGLANEDFVFLTSFDFHSWVERKNPIAAINAFIQAFPDKASPVKLVVKASNGNLHPQALLSLLKMSHDDPRILVLDGILDRAHLRSLQRCCNSYVSLHRAEGFGLGLAECMAMGKPVIATAWSGNLEFMTEDNSCLVPAKLVAVESGEYLHTDGQRWAEADIEQAASAMRKLADEPEYASALGQRASSSIRTSLSPARVGQLLAARLEQVSNAHGVQAMQSALAKSSATTVETK